MFYIIKETGQVVDDTEVSYLYPNVSGINEKSCGHFGLEIVHEIVPNEAPRYFKNVRDGAERVDNKWVTKYRHEPSFRTNKEKAAYILSKIEQDKESIVDEVKRTRDNLMVTGGVKAADKWFKSDSFSRSQYNLLSALGKNIPADLQWKTMDGSFITITQDIIKKVMLSCITSDSEIFNAAEAHIKQIKESDTPWDYDFNKDWPTVFIK